MTPRGVGGCGEVVALGVEGGGDVVGRERTIRHAFVPTSNTVNQLQHSIMQAE